VSKLKNHTSFVVLIAFLLPITFSTIHGDDFLAPFSLANSSNNSYSNAISDISWKIDGHFNFLGELIAVVWSLSLAKIYQFTESASIYYLLYSFTKFIVFALYFALFYFICNRLLDTNNTTRENSKILSLGIFVFFLGYRTTWSSDPVGNYPLLGYSSAIIAILTMILYTSKPIGKRFLKDYLLIYVLAIVASMYYELNALVLLIIIVIDFSVGVVEKNYSLLVAPMFVVCSTLYFVLPKFIANSSNYQGTALSFDLISIRTFLVQVFSGLPLSTIPLAIYFYPGLVALIAVVLALLAKMHFFKISLREFHLLEFSNTSIRGKLFLTMLTLYAFLCTVAFALSEKYQREILWPGQTYMASPVIQFILMLIFFQLLSINKERIRNFYGIAAVLLCLNFTINLVLVYNMHIRNLPSNQLIAGLVEVDEIKRCKYLEVWKMEKRPIYYEELAIESIQGTHEIWFGEEYCGN